MSTRSIRYRLNESNNIWPGFVDVLATLLIVIIFVLMIFTVSQIYLSDAISGRDKALENLRFQINELSKIIVIEKKEKKQALTSLEKTKDDLAETKSDLQIQELYSQELQSDISKKDSRLFIKDQNILALSDQIKELLGELRIVAKALEIYEGAEIASLNTEGLGERINKALASRIDQLNQLNTDLDQVNTALTQSEKDLQNKINDLDIANTALTQSEKDLQNKINDLDIANFDLALNKNELQKKIRELNNLNNNLISINESLGLEDADLIDQLAAIQKKNELLEISQLETKKALQIIEQINTKLILKDEALQDQIAEYQIITNDLLEINDSLGLEDASLVQQLDAIRSKNKELAKLNLNLVEKDNTIFSLRGKIIELNNILTLSEEKQFAQKSQILDLNTTLNVLDNENKLIQEEASVSIEEMKIKSTETLRQVAFLSKEIEILKVEIKLLNAALESSEEILLTKELKIEVLGERLNKALTSKVFELQKYRSEFFGKLNSILGDREDIKIVGDRFIFESELLFDSASAKLQSSGMEKLKQIGLTLKETTIEIPKDIDWIIQVEGHSDKRPIKTAQYPSNWELSTARANSVLKLLLDLGFAPNRLSAAGYGEFYPITEGDSDQALQQNRRIELKLTSR